MQFHNNPTVGAASLTPLGIRHVKDAVPYGVPMNVTAQVMHCVGAG